MLNPRNSNSFVLIIFFFLTATCAVSRLAAQTKDHKLVYGLELNLTSPRETSGVLMVPTSQHQLSIYSFTNGIQKIHNVETDGMQQVRLSSKSLEFPFKYNIHLAEKSGVVALGGATRIDPSIQDQFLVMDGTSETTQVVPELSDWNSLIVESAGFVNGSSVVVVGDNKHDPQKHHIIALAEGKIVSASPPIKISSTEKIQISRERLLVAKIKNDPNETQISVSVFDIRVSNSEITFANKKELLIKSQTENIDCIKDVRFSPSEKRLAIAAFDETNEKGLVGIWDIKNSRCVSKSRVDIGATEEFSPMPFAWADDETLYVFWKEDDLDSDGLCQIVLERIDLGNDKRTVLFKSSRSAWMEFNKLNVTWLAGLGPVATWEEHYFRK